MPFAGCGTWFSFFSFALVHRLTPFQVLLFVCRDRPVRTDITVLPEQKGIDTRHIRRYFAGDLTGQRIRQLNDAVNFGIGRNLDLSPRLMRLAFVGWLSRHGASTRWLAVALSVASLVYLTRITRPQRVLLTTGCVNIGAEMVTFGGSCGRPYAWPV